MRIAYEGREGGRKKFEEETGEQRQDAEERKEPILKHFYFAKIPNSFSNNFLCNFQAIWNNVDFLNFWLCKPILVFSLAKSEQHHHCWQNSTQFLGKTTLWNMKVDDFRWLSQPTPYVHFRPHPKPYKVVGFSTWRKYETFSSWRSVRETCRHFLLLFFSAEVLWPYS